MGGRKVKYNKDKLIQKIKEKISDFHNGKSFLSDAHPSWEALRVQLLFDKEIGFSGSSRTLWMLAKNNVEALIPQEAKVASETAHEKGGSLDDTAMSVELSLIDSSESTPTSAESDVENELFTVKINFEVWDTMKPVVEKKGRLLADQKVKRFISMQPGVWADILRSEVHKK